jgi:cbb3-type cytochrome oxidase subunit 3
VPIRACYLIRWIRSLALTLITAPLVACLWRMHMVLNRGLQRVKVTVTHAMLVICGMVGVQVLILSALTIRGYLINESLTKTKFDENGEEYCYCHFAYLVLDKDSIFNFLYALKCIWFSVLFIAGMYYAYLTKNTPIAENLAKNVLSGKK